MMDEAENEARISKLLDEEGRNGVIRVIADAIGDLEYGSVAITVHAARIVQVEVTRRQRF